MQGHRVRHQERREGFRRLDHFTVELFFRERADWQFVASLIDATMGEKNKILRFTLMKLCRNTQTLAAVQANVRRATKDARRFVDSLLTEIDGYLDLVLPSSKS